MDARAPYGKKCVGLALMQPFEPVNQQRIDVSEAALDDKTRIAEDRIRAQREIAVMNATKANTG